MSITFRFAVFFLSLLTLATSLNAQTNSNEQQSSDEATQLESDDWDDEDWEEEDSDFPDPHSLELEDPIRIEADGKPIDTGKDNGHAGAQVKDWDQDGIPDLLVSSYGGNIRFFKNTGTRTVPVYQEQEELTAEGEPIRIKNW